jgi:hypothetical protein
MFRKHYLIVAAILAITFKTAAQDELPFSTINLQSLKDFKATSGNWKVVGDVYYDINASGKGSTKPGTGVLVNSPTEKSRDHLFTNFQHGDIELELDFMMDKESNAGVYLQGRYEIQMFDSWGVKNPKVTDCGAIYQRWDENRPQGFKGYDGHAPSQNVSKAPGLWQHYRIVFRAPRFDASGKKISNAKFVKVIQNGVTIHENIELTGPTRAAAFEDEKPTGPLMIQGDHGAVAIRNIKYKSYGIEPVVLSNLKLSSYEGTFKGIDDLKSASPKREMTIDLLAHSAPGSRDKFGGKITGSLRLPKTGKYLFKLDLKWIPNEVNLNSLNGQGELMIGGKRIILITGEKGGTATATVDFKAGDYPVTLSYYKNYGFWYARSNDILLSIEGPGVPATTLNAVIPEVDPVGEIKVLSTGEPVMLRGFVNHNGKKRTHVISVGEGSANYSVDLSKGEFLQFWRGDFMEATPMWYGRGETQLGLPLGSTVELSGKPSVAFLNDQKTAWPDSNANYNYNGYDVEGGRPIIKYTLENTSIRETFETADAGKKLVHSFTVNSDIGNKELWTRIAEAKDIDKLENGLYAIDGKQYYIEAKDPVIRATADNKKEMLLPVKGKAQYTIIW